MDAILKKVPAGAVGAGLPLLSVIAATPVIGAVQPYGVDSITLHLWHLNETTTPCVDSAPGGTNLISLLGGATLDNASFTGFSNAFGGTC